MSTFTQKQVTYFVTRRLGIMLNSYSRRDGVFRHGGSLHLRQASRSLVRWLVDGLLPKRKPGEQGVTSREMNIVI